MMKKDAYLRFIFIIVFISIIAFFVSAISIANTTRDLGREPVLKKFYIANWIVFYTNIERVNKGLAPLYYDPVLEKAAEWQAEYCSKIRNLDHYSNVSGMKTPKDRMEKFGRLCGFCGENLTVNFAMNSEGVPYRIINDAEGKYFDFGDRVVQWRNERELADAMVVSWMKSKYHRDNILNEGYLWIGAGTAKGIYNNNTSYYGCQVFNGYGGLNSDYIKIKYELSGLELKRNKGSQGTYVFIYKGNLEPVIVELKKDEGIITHEFSNKAGELVFIKNSNITGGLYGALKDRTTNMVYPVIPLK